MSLSSAKMNVNGTRLQFAHMKHTISLLTLENCFPGGNDITDQQSFMELKIISAFCMTAHVFVIVMV